MLALLICLVMGEGVKDYPHPVWGTPIQSGVPPSSPNGGTKGYPSSVGQMGYPHQQDRGIPCLEGWGYPPAQEGWGVLPVRKDGGTPPPVGQMGVHPVLTDRIL